MKKFFYLMIAFMAPVLLTAQVQNGYVKTKGVLNADGSVSAGKRLANVTINIKGVNPILSHGNGAFSFNVPGKTFYLSGIKKQGYTLADPEATRLPYSFTTSQMVIVVEDEQERQSAILQATGQIRRAMYQQLMQREDEIRALNKSAHEKELLLQQLYDQQARSDQLIASMAERYVSTDYDQINEQLRRINALIMEGKLAQADSLIGSREDLERLEESYHEQEKTAKEAQRLADLAKKDAEYKKKDLTERYYSKYSICAQRLQSDSAFFYLSKLADLDTLNVHWQQQASFFANNVLSDYEKAVFYNVRAIDASEAVWGTGNEATASLFVYMAAIHFTLVENYEYALQCLQVAGSIYVNQGGENAEGLILVYQTMGNACMFKGDTQQALACFEKALEICQNTHGENSVEAAGILESIGDLYIQSNQKEQSLPYLLKARDIYTQIGHDDPKSMAVLYHTIGWATSDPAERLKYFQQALTFTQAVKQKDPMDNYDAKIYCSIGNLYNSSDSAQAVHYYDLAMNRCLQTVGRKNQITAEVYEGFAMLYYQHQDYEKAIGQLGQVAEIMHDIGGGSHSKEAEAYDVMGDIYMQHLQDAANGALCKQKALEVYERVFGERDERVADAAYNIATSLYHTDKQQARFFYEKSIDIWSDNPEKNFLSIAMAGQFLGDIYHDMGNEEKALFHQRFSIQEINYAMDADSPDSLGANSQVLAYGSWNISQYCSYELSDLQTQTEGQPVTIVLKNKDAIRCYTLPANTPLKISHRFVPAETKQQLIDAYQNWPLKDKKRTEELAVDSVLYAHSWIPDGAGAKQGLDNDCIVLKYGDWDITQPLTSQKEIIRQFAGKPKDVMLLHNGQITSHHFEDKMGAYMSVLYLSPKAKKNIIKGYRKWMK